MQENQEYLLQRANENKASLKKMFLAIREWIQYFVSKWHIIFLFALVGAILGLGYSLTKKTLYTATTSFVLEGTGKTGALGTYAGIASSFGIDLGGAGGGLFEGENILELYKSRNIIINTLLDEANFGMKKQMLINRYIDFNKLREKWEQNPELRNFQFNQNNQYSTPKEQLLHDSILKQIVSDISKKNLLVEKKDKKLNIIYVTVRSHDELFSKAFNEKLVNNVNNFYLSTKSKRNLANITILQAKADSVRNNLKGAINHGAAVADATPNQNPSRMAQRIAPMQNARVNAEINQQVLSTLLQNLEISKINLLKDTPLIQIVDGPMLPLEKSKVGRFFSIIVGTLIFTFIAFTFLFFKKFILDILS